MYSLLCQYEHCLQSAFHVTWIMHALFSFCKNTRYKNIEAGFAKKNKSKNAPRTCSASDQIRSDQMEFGGILLLLLSRPTV